MLYGCVAFSMLSAAILALYKTITCAAIQCYPMRYRAVADNYGGEDHIVFNLRYVPILMEFPTLPTSNIQEENPSGRYGDRMGHFPIVNYLGVAFQILYWYTRVPLLLEVRLIRT